MSRKPLAEIIQETIRNEQVRLPVYPAVARQFQELVAQGAPPADRLARLAGGDPALACNLFHAANSSFYRGLQKVATIAEAITRIGLDAAVETVARACHDGEACAGTQLVPRYLPPLWRHSLGCALGAHWLARRCGYQALAEQARMAGLLHDIGKLFLLGTLEAVCSCGEEPIMLPEQLIAEVMSTMHVEQGLELVERWHLPDDFAAVIGRHHETGNERQEAIIALVRLANKGCHKLGLGWSSDPGLILPTTAEAQFLGIDEISLAEFEIMLEDHFALLPEGATPGA